MEEDSYISIRSYSTATATVQQIEKQKREKYKIVHSTIQKAKEAKRVGRQRISKQ